MGCHSLLQGIFPTQGSNPGLPRCRQTLYRLNRQGRLTVPVLGSICHISRSIRPNFSWVPRYTPGTAPCCVLVPTLGGRLIPPVVPPFELPESVCSHGWVVLRASRIVTIPPTAPFYGEFITCDFPGGSDGKVSAYNAGDLGLIPGLGRSPGEGNVNPL